jgi:hypothetical protein
MNRRWTRMNADGYRVGGIVRRGFPEYLYGCGLRWTRVMEHQVIDLAGAW